MSLRSIRILLLVLLALEGALLVFGPQTRDHLPAIQSALAANQRPEWWDDAAMGIRYAAWVNLALLLCLLSISRCWARSLSSSVENPAPGTRHPAWFWPLAVVATLACLGLRLPLASKSLWWDEAWVVLQVSHGKWRPDPKHPDDLKFMAHDWKRCAFYYQKPTNHVPMSLAQKASFNAWRTLTGAPREEFSDLAARFPALIASCAAVLLLALLLRSWNSPGAGIVAAFLLALHPWYLRYGVDARAYAFVVPLGIAGLLAITRILRTDGVRVLPWISWGAVEFLWLWAYPNAVLDILALNIVALVLLLRDRAAAGHRWTLLFRFAATHLFAAICFIQLFLPNVMQARRWAGHEADAHVLDWELAKSTFSQLFFGLEFNIPAVPEAAGLPSLGALPCAQQVGSLLFIIAILVIGLVSLWKASRRGCCLVLSILCSAVGFALITRAAGSYFYPRFLVVLLPCIAILAAMAFTPNGRRGRMGWTVALAAIIIAAFGFSSLVGQQVRVLLTRPIAPLRDAASFVQRQAAALEKPPLIACYGLGREVMPVYERHSVPVENLAELERMIQQASSEQRALFVIQGYPFFNRQLLSSGFKLLDDPARFEELKAFPGIDPEFYFRVFRLNQSR